MNEIKDNSFVNLDEIIYLEGKLFGIGLSSISKEISLRFLGKFMPLTLSYSSEKQNVRKDYLSKKFSDEEIYSSIKSLIECYMEDVYSMTNKLN